jgi:predicted DNA binding CopG/RHH family protein
LGPEPFELDDATAARLASLTEAADRELEEERVGLRWSARPLGVVKRAAALHGVPYQTYMKQVTLRQALTDLKDAIAAGVLGRDAEVEPSQGGNAL